jgi:hypothetical protein
VVTATGDRFFSTGADVGAVAARGGVAAGKGPLYEEVHWSPRQNRVWKPTVTAVNGMVAGAGLHFVVDADIIVAAEPRSPSTRTSTSGWWGDRGTSGSPSGSARVGVRMTLCGKKFRMSAGARPSTRPRRRGGAGRQCSRPPTRSPTRSRQLADRGAAVDAVPVGSLEMPYTQSDGVRPGAAADALGPPRLQRVRAPSPRSATLSGTRSRRRPATDDLTLVSEEEQFRHEVAEFLAANRSTVLLA